MKPKRVRSLPKRDALQLVHEWSEIEAVSAQDAGELAFVARLFAQTSLPYRDPGGIQFWSRSNGAVTIVMQQGVWKNPRTRQLEPAGYPYGTIPRLVLAWLSTEVTRTRQRDLSLGHSLSGFMGELGLSATGGRWGSVTRLRKQIERLFRCSITSQWDVESETGVSGSGLERMDVARKFALWWDDRDPEADTLWESKVILSEPFFEQLINRPVPIDFRALRRLRGSALRLDIYMWLTYRMSYLRKATAVTWEHLRQQFGANFSDDRRGHHAFRREFTQQLGEVLLVYTEARAEVTERGLLLRPSPTHVRRRSG